MKNNNIIKTIFTLLCLAITACGSSGGAADPGVDPSASAGTTSGITISAFANNRVTITCPLDSIGVTQADLDQLTFSVTVNGEARGTNIAAKPRYSADADAIVFVLTAVSLGDDIVVTFTLNGTDTNYTGTVDDVETTATAGAGTGGTGTAGDNTADELYLLTIGQIDANGDAVVSFNINVLDTELDRDYLVLLINETTADFEGEYQLNYDETVPYADENGIVSLVFHNVSDQDQLLVNIYLLDGKDYTGPNIRFSATQSQEFDMTPHTGSASAAGLQK